LAGPEMMGWLGRQEDPGIRKEMTEELSCLFARWGWEFAVCDPALPRKVLIEPPIWYVKRQLMKENPDKYGRGKAKGIHFDHISPILEITVKKCNMAAQKMVRRDGLSLPVVRKGRGRVMEASFAFAVGENLSTWERDWIAAQDSEDVGTGEFDGQDDTISPSPVKNLKSNVPRMEMKTSMATPVGLFPFLCLLMAIKRLWIPGLEVWGTEGCGGVEWADRQRLFIRPAVDTFGILRSDALHHAFVKSFPGFPMHDWELWEKESDFKKRNEGRSAPSWETLATMMDLKFSAAPWREATVQALVDLGAGFEEEIKAMGIWNLGDLVEHGRRMGSGKRSPLDVAVIEYYARAFWFLADEESGAGEGNLLYRIQPPDRAPEEGANADRSGLRISAKIGEVPSCPYRFNPPEEVQALREEAIREAVSADPGSLPAIYRILAEVGNLPGRKGVIHADALAVEVRPDLLLLHPVWEILPRLPLFRRHLGGVSPGDPALVSLFRDLFEAAETLSDRGVSSREGTRKWLRDTIEDGKMSGWRMAHEFLYREMDGGGHSGLPWGIVPAIARFFGDWAGRTRLSVAPLCDPLKDWLPSRAAGLLESCGLRRLADLAEWNGMRLAEHIKDDADRSLTITAINDLTGKSPAADCLANGLGLRFNLMGPGEARPYWPLAHSMAASMASCLDCMHNRPGANEGERSCSLRSRPIEKEYEEFCLHYYKNRMVRKPGRPFKETVGPVYRLLPGGPVGFRPLP